MQMRGLKEMKRILILGILLTSSIFCLSCAGGGSVPGNEMGSTPISEAERTEYEKAVRRCHKTGGTRVVKIKGDLRCF